MKIPRHIYTFKHVQEKEAQLDFDKRKKYSMTATLVLLIFIFNARCVTIKYQTSYLDIISRIEKLFPNQRILKLADLDEDTKEYFLNITKNSDPGIVCSTFISAKQTSCAVLLTSSIKDHNTRKLVFIPDVTSIEPKVEVIEDYSLEKRKITNLFLIFQEKTVLHNQGEGAHHFKMVRDGVKRIAFGQSAVILYWNDNHVEKFWTAD